VGAWPEYDMCKEDIDYDMEFVIDGDLGEKKTRCSMGAVPRENGLRWFRMMPRSMLNTMEAHQQEEATFTVRIKLTNLRTMPIPDVMPDDAPTSGDSR